MHLSFGEILKYLKVFKVEYSTDSHVPGSLLWRPVAEFGDSSLLSWWQSPDLGPVGSCLHEDTAFLSPHCSLHLDFIFYTLIFSWVQSFVLFFVSRAQLRFLLRRIGSAAPEEMCPFSNVSTYKFWLIALYFCMLPRTDIIKLLCYHTDFPAENCFSYRK